MGSYTEIEKIMNFLKEKVILIVNRGKEISIGAIVFKIAVWYLEHESFEILKEVV